MCPFTENPENICLPCYHGSWCWRDHAGSLIGLPMECSILRVRRIQNKIAGNTYGQSPPGFRIKMLLLNSYRRIVQRLRTYWESLENFKALSQKTLTPLLQQDF